jgi:hypothetical protein
MAHCFRIGSTFRQFAVLNFGFLILNFCSTLHAQDAKPPTFVVHAAGDSHVAGPLARLGRDWSISLAGDKPATIPGSDLNALRRQNAVLPSTPQEEHGVLANGDRIPGKLRNLTAERVTLQTPIADGEEMTVPLAAVTLWWFAAPTGIDDVPLLRRRLATERRRRDVILLRNGDRIEGEALLGVDAREARLKVRAGKEVAIERDKIAALTLNTELARLPRARKPYARLVLADGCRLTLASAEADEKTLVGKTLFEAPVRIPVGQIIALSVHEGRVVYLSDLKPLRYEHTPYLGQRWPYTRDASVAGYDLRLGGETYDKGIGMHSESRLTYDLNGEYAWFETLVGLDDQTGRKGSVDVQVLVDGKPQDPGKRTDLTMQDGPRPIRVSVSGAKELTLVVGFGRHGDVQDVVDWVDARLVK